jgi:hypothetical protein
MSREIPTSFKEAAESSVRKEWRQAMDEEMASFSKTNTWILVRPEPNDKIVDCKWIYKIKTNPDGSEKFKARLVARGFHQRPGIDFNETYAPVIRYDSIRILLALAAKEDLEIVQFDVTTAFLHGNLKERILMKQPPGYNDGTERVCLLKKSLYGLKQAPKEWNEKFNEILENLGLTQTPTDPCVYVTKKGERVTVRIYVDDGIIISHSKSRIEEILKGLSNHVVKSLDQK